MRVSIGFVVATAILATAVVATLIAFLPTYLVGVEGVQDTVAVLRRNVIARIDNGVQLFFRGPGSAINAIVTAHEAGLNVTALSLEERFRFLCGTLKDFAASASAVAFMQPGTYTTCNKQFGLPLAGSVSGVGKLTGFQWDLEAGNFTQPMPSAPFLEVDFNTYTLWNDVWASEPYERRWSSVTAGLGTLLYVATAPLLDADGMLTSRLTIDINTDSVRGLMTELGLLKSGRAVIYDRDTMHAFSTSFPATLFRLLPGWADLNLPQDQRMIKYLLSQIDDPLVQKVVGNLGGDAGVKALGNASLDLFSGSDKTYVDVKAFTDQYQLQIGILVAMPESDFLEDIVSARQSTIGGVCGALVGMILLGVLLAVLLTRPLKRLSQRMYLTASLQDSGEDDPPSALSEIASMQDAYSTMRSELNRMKAYLPQSVLQNDDDDEDLEEPDKASSVVSSVRNSSRDGVSDTQSHTSGRSAVVAIGAGLNLKREVHRRRVTIACFNTVNFHDVMKHSAHATNRVTEIQSKYLAVVAQHVRDNKGVVDFFQGDRVMASFNAVKAIVSAGKRAVGAAMGVVEAASKADSGLPCITVGLSAAQAMVGNMGTTEMTRFNVISACVQEAAAVERFATNCFTKNAAADANKPTATRGLVLFTDSLLADVELEISVEALDAVKLSGETPSIVFAAHGSKNVAEEEWMYQLEAGAKADVFVQANQCFMRLKADQIEEAQALLNDVPAERASRLRELIDKGEEWKLHATDVGFYSSPRKPAD